MVSQEPVPVVQMKNIGKCFGKNRVLKGVNFDIYPGEVHALVGENGAGKSTLINILSGVHTSYEGENFFNGKKINPASPLDANNIGIAIIHQELSLIPAMSVSDNMFLGRTRTKAGFVQYKEQLGQAKQYLESVGLDIDPDRPIEYFPISVQQLIKCFCPSQPLNPEPLNP